MMHISVLRHQHTTKQGGQALVEGLVVLVVLVVLWVAIAWLARLQDIALQASHASRFVAFTLARDPGARPLAQSRAHYFSGPAHQWKDQRGKPLFSPAGYGVRLEVTRSAALDATAQPGGASHEAEQLRQGWHIQDKGIAQASVMVSHADPGNVDLGYPTLVRHTAILTGSGHASSDVDTQRRVAESPTGWRDSAYRSYELGRTIDTRVAPLDQGWNRTRPHFDWLTPWAGLVPAQHGRPMLEAAR